MAKVLLIETLKYDIKVAEQGHVPYFSILKATDEIVGLIWKHVSVEDLKYFDKHFGVLWNAYDYPMPLQNAHRVMRSLESGQLAIESGFSHIGWDSSNEEFRLTCIDSDNESKIVHRAKYVINATGQGLDVTKLESPLIRNALKHGTIVPHELGGVNVEFFSGAVKNSQGHYSRRIYAVGSLTRGVHFYTNSINENAKCGKRTVEAVVIQALTDIACRGEEAQ